MPKLTVSAVEREHLWLDLEVASTLLLQGDHAPAEVVNRVNAALRKAGEPAADALVDKRPNDIGLTAKRVALACGVDDGSGLRGAIGVPASPLWQQRYLGASHYEAIARSNAFERLTTGVDDVGRSAALARLLAHHPKNLARDGIFHALAGLRCIAAKAASYVDAFFALAEGSKRAGVVLAVFPDSAGAQFRSAFGVEGQAGRAPYARDGLTAEVFLDGKGLAPADLTSRVTKWMGEARASGWLVHGDAEGKCRVVRFVDGKGTEQAARDPDALKAAVKALDVRGLFAPLGLPDLLEPGPFERPTRIGG
jgi:hypothetical protein